MQSKTPGDHNPISGAETTHFRVKKSHACDSDAPDTIGDTLRMMGKKLIDTACALTGLSGTAFAALAGLPQSTLHRLQTGGNQPRLDTISKMSAAIRAHAAGRQDSEAILHTWTTAVCEATGLDSAIIFDAATLEMVIVQARHDLRHVFADLPADKIAQAICGAYQEVKARQAEDAKRDA